MTAVVMISLAVGIVVLAVVVARLVKPGLSPQNLSYSVQPLLSAEATAFYVALKEAVGTERAVLVRVRLAGLVEPRQELVRCDRDAVMKRLNSLYIDFLICDADGLMPVCAIDFDECTQKCDPDRASYGLKEAVLRSAGLPWLRYRVGSLCDPRKLKADIDAAIGARGV